MTSSLFDTRPILTRKEVIWVIGLILGGIGYGALLALGINSLVILLRSSRIGGGRLNLQRILSLHVLLVILFNTFLQVWNAQSNIKAIFYTDPNNITFFYHDWENIFIVFLAMLTEGVLVWRCYMILKVVPAHPSPRGWHHIFWVFPVLLWLTGVVLGMTAVARLHPTASLFDKSESTSPGLTLFLAALAINFVLNVFATSNIVIRLLLHRRYVIAAFGRKSALAEYSLHISSILLESAAINLPLALLSIVGLLVQADFAALLTQIITPGQCIASILVIYQVAKGRTVVERKISLKSEPISTPDPELASV